MMRVMRMINITESLTRVEAFRQASPHSIAALAACCKVRCLAKWEHLFFDKDHVEKIYVVASGLVSLYKMNFQGEKKVIFILDQGKMINEVILQGMSASVNCEAFEEAEVLCFDRAELLAIMERDFGLTKGILDSLGLKVRRLYRQLKNTANSVRGEKRVAAKLWKLSQDYGEVGQEGKTITLHLSITYLADMLGSKRETVSRQLKVLTEQGLVRIYDGHIIIPDSKKLSAYVKLP